jgi:hypothetical protein
MITQLGALSGAQRQGHIDQIAGLLRPVLEKYYRVNGLNFFELDCQGAYQHQLLHLAKLLNKIIRYDRNRDDPILRGIIQNEVAPDLLIYAQEIYFKSDAECWRPSGELSAGADSLRTLLFHPRVPGFDEVLGLVAHASATLADFCDCNDHKKAAKHDLSTDVAIPMTDASAAIIQAFELDPHTLYLARIQSMIEKYEGWSLPAQ